MRYAHCVVNIGAVRLISKSSRHLQLPAQNPRLARPRTAEMLYSSLHHLVEVERSHPSLAPFRTRSGRGPDGHCEVSQRHRICISLASSSFRLQLSTSMPQTLDCASSAERPPKLQRNSILFGSIWHASNTLSTVFSTSFRPASSSKASKDFSVKRRIGFSRNLHLSWCSSSSILSSSFSTRACRAEIHAASNKSATEIFAQGSSRSSRLSASSRRIVLCFSLTTSIREVRCNKDLLLRM
mmetsp:Transcript_43669/g.92915  ORF Transcript_43669/g.92915 Transcript_43669/m.92915 type:complete len:240 (-) Transcript_43669:1020-1739(-)